MARRRQKQLIDPSTFIDLSLVLAAIWIGIQLFQQPAFWLLLSACVLAVLAYLVARILRRNAARHALLQRARGIISQHTPALVTRKRQLVWPDAYGKPQLDKWEKEVNNFMASQIEPALSAGERSAMGRERATIARLIEAHVQAAIGSDHSFRAFSVDMTPADFEAFCAEELQRVGWNTRVTMQTRDQGTDIVAEKGGIRVVLQCKLYSRPVGNKAVQEVAAARTHEQAGYGVVVTNNSYTQAASQLATTNGVYLLHYGDLRSLDKVLGVPPPSPVSPAS